MLDLTLDVIEWMARGKKNGTESAAADCSKCRVAVLFRHLEGATRGINPLRERPCPREQSREEEIGPSPKMIPLATFEQIAGHPSKPISLIVLTEADAGDYAHCRAVVRCGRAIAAFQADIGGPEDAERVQIIV